MPAWSWIVIAAAVVIVVAMAVIVARSVNRRNRSERLKNHFGPEYERAVGEAGDQRAGEKELVARERKRQKLDIVALAPEAHAKYAEYWRTVQLRSSTIRPRRSSSAQTEPSEMGTGSSTARTEPSSDKSLFADADLPRLRSRWDDVQAAFVDDPKKCVQEADALVAEVVEQLTTGFSAARSRLEAQWARGEEASTEDLRLSLKRYREFFQRLLSV